MKKSEVIIFRITPDLKAVLFDAAKVQGISASKVLINFLNTLKAPKNG
jgi:hypothetical protein